MSGNNAPNLDAAVVSSRDFLFRQLQSDPDVEPESVALHNREWSIKELREMAIGPLIVSVVGLMIHLAADHLPGRSIWVMLGDALVVGGVVAITLEAFVSKTLIDRAARALSERLVGSGLPEDLQGAIGDLVHRTTFIHDRSSVEYSIRLHPSDTQLVVVRIRRRYRVWNYGKSVLPYTPEIADEGFHRPRFLSLECFQGGSSIARLAEEDLNPHVIPESRGIRVTGPTIQLDAYRGLRHADYTPVDVIWTMEITVPANYSDVTAFSCPTVGGFEIQRIEIPDGFEFDATREASTIHANGGAIWRYQSAHLSGQHLRVWWRPIGNGTRITPNPTIVEH